MKFKAISAESLSDFFKDIGQYSSLISGHLKCATCGLVITLDNFGGVYRKDDKYFFFCCNIECNDKSSKGDIHE